MELAFRKIAKDGSDFSIRKDKVNFFGKIFLKSPSMALLEAKIDGTVEHICDRCAEDLLLELDEHISIMVSDGIYKGEVGEFDVIEMDEGLIKFDEILQSEIESYKSDYHYCDRCKTK